MSGHSKWSTIKRQKGAEDAKRGQLFTKLGRMITLAVRESGGTSDPASNFKLRLAIDKAKQINMPKENIQRAIDRGTGKGSEGDSYESIVYEGYGPSGVALIIDAATDNKKRTASQIKFVLDRNGGSLGSPGSVSFMFEQQGLIVVAKDSISEETLFEKAIEEGAIDVQTAEDGYEVYTKHDDLHRVREHLESQGCVVKEASLIYHPTTVIPVDGPTAQKVISLIEQLEEQDDVQQVYTNFDSAD